MLILLPFVVIVKKVVENNWLYMTLPSIKENKNNIELTNINSDLNYESFKMHRLSLELLSVEVNNNINTTTSNHNRHKPWL